jgi:hypothetical protein
MTSHCHQSSSNLNFLLTRDGVVPKKRPPINPWSSCSYNPIQLDRAHPQEMGRDTLNSEYTATSLLGGTAVRALDVIAESSKPFILTVSFNAPVRLLSRMFVSFVRSFRNMRFSVSRALHLPSLYHSTHPTSLAAISWIATITEDKTYLCLRASRTQWKPPPIGPPTGSRRSAVQLAMCQK